MSRLNKPWEGICWTKPCPPPSYSQICSDGHIVTSQTDLFNVMHNQFVKTDLLSTVDWDFVNSIESRPTRAAPWISALEVTQALQSTSNMSAPGPDHITWRLLKSVLSSDAVVDGLTFFFNQIFDSSIWPHALKTSTTVIIPKLKKNDYSLPKAYRPIALLNTLGKLLTKILANRLQFDSITENLFHPGQCGGIKKHATIDAGLIITNFIIQSRNRGLLSSVLAVDIAQFFPSINHDVMTTILTKLGFDLKIANLVSSFFRTRKTNYRWGESYSKEYDISVGTPQGDPISPVLSVLYIAVILNAQFPWSYTEWDINCLFYINDGCFFTCSPSMKTDIQRLSLSLCTLMSKVRTWTTKQQI